MFDNATNQTQDHINSDSQQTFNTADSVVKAPQKAWRLSTLERSSLFGVWFFAFFFAFRAGRGIMEWQFGLTIALAVVMTVVIPVFSRENKRVTNERNDKPSCTCFFCSIDQFIVAGIGLIPVLAAWISGKTSYKLVAGLGGILIIFVPILYLENERVTSQLSEEITEPRTFWHALTFLGLAIFVSGVGWGSGTVTCMFIETAIPKLTFL